MRRLLLFFILLFGTTFIFSLEDNFQFHIQGKTFVVDDFEDGELSHSPKWWAFGGLEISIEDNNKEELLGLGNKSMRLRGYPEKWYIGGVGAYFSADLRPYNALKLLVRGRGKSSGTLVIELYDDDNNNWTIEAQDNDATKVKFDDKFIYSQQVDWLGWRVVIIPLDKFVDANPGIGDDKWNPYRTDTSGGLLQMQFIFSAREKDKVADIQLDVIKFFNYNPPKVKEVRRESNGW